jgi:hypothetical protein
MYNSYTTLEMGGDGVMVLPPSARLEWFGKRAILAEHPHPSTGSGQAFSQKTREMGYPVCITRW